MPFKNKLCYSLSLLLILCWEASQVYGDPVSPQAQAEAIAQRFLWQVAASTMNAQAASNTSSAILSRSVTHHTADKAPDDLSNQDNLSVIDNHPSEYWQIEQPGIYRLEVDESTGHILSFINFTALSVDGEPPAGESLPKAQIRQLAEDALRATGIPLNKFAFASMEEYQNHLPPLASEHEWYVFWLRTCQGIPYRGKGAEVCLNAETGKIISVSFGIRYADPVATNNTITQEQARSIAEAQLNAVGLAVSDLPVVTVGKEIVPFNRYWETGDELHHSVQTRVAWNFHYGTSLTTIEVWVDAATGDIVGGYYTGTLGRETKTLTPKFGHQLTHSDMADKNH